LRTKLTSKRNRIFYNVTDDINKQLHQVYIGQFHCNQLKTFYMRTICLIVVQMKTWNPVAVKTANIQSQKSVQSHWPALVQSR